MSYGLVVVFHEFTKGSSFLHNHTLRCVPNLQTSIESAEAGQQEAAALKEIAGMLRTQAIAAEGRATSDRRLVASQGLELNELRCQVGRLFLKQTRHRHYLL